MLDEIEVVFDYELISRVVVVNPEVSLAFELQRPSSVFCECIKHLIWDQNQSKRKK